MGAQGARDFVNEFNKGRPAGTAGRRSRRRHAAGRRRSAALQALPAGDAGAASDRGVFPRRRLGARRPAIRRSVLPRHVPPHRHGHRQRRLSPCARASLPGRGRRRLCGDALDRRPRRRARRQAGTAARRRLERRRQYRRRHLPAGARPRRARDRGPIAGVPGHRLHLRSPVLHRQRGELLPDPRADVLVLGSLLLTGRSHRSARLAVARQARRAAAGVRDDLRVRSAARRRHRLCRGDCRSRRAGRAAQGRAATSTRPSPWSMW